MRRDDRVAITSQLLFVEAEGPEVELDALLLGAWHEAGLPAGMPVHLRLSRPGNELLSSLVASVLEEWAETAQVVNLEIRPVGGSPRVAVSNGEATVTLVLTGSQ